VTTARHLRWISTRVWQGLLAGSPERCFRLCILPPPPSTWWPAAQPGSSISGFDPVAYFTERAALPGKGSFERAVACGVWRFSNKGNHAAFAADPDDYMPRFGG